MESRERTSAAAGSTWLAVRLHDVSAGLAIGIGLVKGWQEYRPGTAPQAPNDALDVLEQVLTELRQLSRAVSSGAPPRRRSAALRESLQREARSIGVELDLKVAGQESSLSVDEAELVRVAAREAIRNVKRHSGTSRCRITIDLSARPFVLTARDWGAGIRARGQLGAGISLLETLAGDMGAELNVISQPGLGVELMLKGPLPGAFEMAKDPGDSVRSVVAKESPSSRRRVASKRPFSTFEQQIT